MTSSEILGVDATVDPLLLLRSAPVSILFLRPDLTIVDATDRYLEDTMRTRESIVGLPLFVAFPENPDDEQGHEGPSALRGSLDRVRSTRLPDTMPVQRYDIPRPDGTGFEVRYWTPINTPVLDHRGEISLIHHQVTEITDYISTVSETERRADVAPLSQEQRSLIEREIIERSMDLHRTAAALRASEERFRLVCEATSDALWDWDVASNRLWWSDGIERVFGYRPCELSPLLDSWSALIHPDDHDVVLASLEAAMVEGDDEWEREYRFMHRDGHVVWVKDSCLIVRDADGAAVRLVGGMADITESRLIEEQFHRSQRMESLGLLAGGVAHDLNNALSPVLMGAEMLAADELDPDRREVLDLIIRSAVRSGSMIQQVLAFARGTPRRSGWIDVPTLVNDLARFLRTTFPPNITIRIEPPDPGLAVTGDPTMLHQVLLNLCVNARDAMRDGGELSITCHRTIADASDSQDSVAIRVRDSGCGMNPDVVSRIFDPFFTTKPIGSGTGLGLSTSHSIVRSHGGTITVETEPDVGSTFAVHLPIAADGDVQPHAEQQLPRGEGQSILLIDDEESVLALTSQALDAAGYRVRTAASGDAAIELITSDDHDIQLVITDMSMPGLDGASTILALREIQPNLTFVAVSGLDADDVAARTSDVDIDVRHFLSKPYTAGDLLEAVEAALSDR